MSTNRALKLGHFAATAQPRKAPSSLYLKGIGAGFVCGFGLETLLVKSGYYNIILKSEAKQILREKMKNETEEAAAPEAISIGPS
ncbi:hypothetical protein BC830DRAFT_1171307 [Chytriomyces sp. MP71]|nr:hypothetical protein BC830DRAFT_1171307 [Chytriomyces sp. MP71]